jgi:alpha-tubulin suppressor-like RCC1 family protein
VRKYGVNCLVLAALGLGVYATPSPAQAAGEVWGSGWNSHHQLGIVDNFDKKLPVQAIGVSVVAVSCGLSHNLGLRSNGTIQGWGYNGHGQVGDGSDGNDRSPAVDVIGVTNAIAVSAGGYHSLALLSNRTVLGWGYNNNGQLGDGTTGGVGNRQPTPVQVSGLTDVIAISGGGHHSLALKSDGSVWAWGLNDHGRLGDGTTIDRLTPVQVVGLSGVIAISAGASHNLAIRADGTLWAWGQNAYGQLGDGTAVAKSTPVQITAGVSAVAAGRDHSLALMSDGTVWAWGSNQYGQLGDNTQVDHHLPAPVADLAGVTDIGAGSVHSLAIKPDGTLWAWGNNGWGQLGDDTETNRLTPVQVTGLTDVAAVSGGAGHIEAVIGPLGPAAAALQVSDRNGIITEPVTLAATLTRVSDNTGIPGRAIDFKIDGVAVGSATTDAAGLASYEWVIDPGPLGRTIGAEFAGDALYAACAGTAVLTARTVATKVYVVDRTAKVKSFTVLKAYLFLLNNQFAPAGKPMTIKLDGTVIGTGPTNATGCFPIGYTVAEGAGSETRVILGEWAGDAGYLASSNKGALTVTKGDLYVWPYARTGKAGTSHPLMAFVRSLPDYVIQPGKSIAFSVNGTSVGTGLVAADGWASTPWAIPAGESAGAHTITAEFAGDAWYLAVAASATFNVVP